MKLPDQYSLSLLGITALLTIAFAVTGRTELLDLVKVSLGALLVTLQKKAETTVIVGDAANKYVEGLMK